MGFRAACVKQQLYFLSTQIHTASIKFKAQEVEISLSHPFQNRERDGAAEVGVSDRKTTLERKGGPAPRLIP
jgi:hypothetical protein